MTKLEIYNVITRCFIGCLVKHGCALRAQRLFFDLLQQIKINVKNKQPLVALATVLLDIKPSVSIWKKKHGGTTYQLPYLITDKKGLEIAIHWFVKDAFKKKTRRGMLDCLVNQFLDCVSGRNTEFQKRRDEIHKISLANRPFLRYK